MKIKFYENPYKTISVRTFDLILSDPPPDGCSVIIRSRESLLFRNDQLKIILDCIKSAKDLLQHENLPKCESIKGISLDLSVPSLIRALGEVAKRKCKRFWSSCDVCEALSSHVPYLGDAECLIRALAPHRLPNPNLKFEEPAYSLYPYSVFVVDDGGAANYAPILDRIEVMDLIKVHKAVKKIRGYERAHLEDFTVELQNIVEYRKRLVSKICDLDKKLSTYAAYSSVGLAKIFPLLMDENISDFYFDREETFAYIDHRDYGRCLTTVYLDSNSMNRLMTFARIAADRAFDRSSPYVRTTLKTREFHMRLSAEIPPLSIEGTSVSVRKFFSKPLHLSDLVSNGTITREATVYCIERLKEKKNFTVYGESGSGKTTLAVALDLLAPKGWRKISIETEIVENVPQIQMGSHQVRLLVGASSEEERERRAAVINSLLQKSPDYVFFGEVLSKEDSLALFQLLSAGLKCIHTIHADSAESLLTRWVYQHQIPVQLLCELDVLVQTRKLITGGRIIRKVARISEISKACHNDLPSITDIFLLDDSGRLQPAHDIFDGGEMI